jgi:hypothetical protein
MGMSDRLTAFGSLYTTALVFGTLQTEIGVVRSFTEPSGWLPGLSVAPAANVATDVREWNVKVWPQVDLHAYWTPGGRHLVYTGLSNWFELARTRAHGEDQPDFWIPSPQAGYVHTRGAWDYAAELKFLAPGVGNTDVTVDYVSPGDRGAVGVYFGVTRRF